MLCIFDKILQTGSGVKKYAAASMQEDIAFSDRFKRCLKIMADSEVHK